MDVAAFDRVATSFAAFHAQFAPLFGRDEAQEHSEQYLRGLFVQHADRRNAEILAEAIAGASPRALQRFVTASPWDDARVLTRLQRVVGTQLSAPDGVWVLDDRGFPKQGTHGGSKADSGRSRASWPRHRRGLPNWKRSWRAVAGHRRRRSTPRRRRAKAEARTAPSRRRGQARAAVRASGNESATGGALHHVSFRSAASRIPRSGG